MRTKVAIVGIEWDVVDLIDSMPHLELAGFFDPSPVEAYPLPYLGKDDAWKRGEYSIVLAVDQPDLRASLFEYYGKEAVMTLQSPHAHVSHRAALGHGLVVQRGAMIMPRAKLGWACKINVNAAVHHDADIGSYCTLAPGAQILGRVVLEDRVYVGAGAIIRQRCRIGTGAVIGAGAVVVRDIPPRVTVAGVPARELYASKS